jgi:hypothetical protein
VSGRIIEAGKIEAREAFGISTPSISTMFLEAL